MRARYYQNQEYQQYNDGVRGGKCWAFLIRKRILISHSQNLCSPDHPRFVANCGNFMKNRIAQMVGGFLKILKNFFIINIKLILMNRRQCSIPLREVNWKKYQYLHNRVNSIFYDCECGKRFISFPAIYLHFRRKHNRKLSYNGEETQCEIRKSPQQISYFYLIDGKSSFSITAPNTKENQFSELAKQAHLLDLFSDFEHENHQNLKAVCTTSYLREILRNLERFVNSSEAEPANTTGGIKPTGWNMPLYLNGFALQQIEQGKFCRIQQYATFCYILLELSRWLKRKGITDLNVELEEERIQERMK